MSLKKVAKFVWLCKVSCLFHVCLKGRQGDLLNIVDPVLWWSHHCAIQCTVQWIRIMFLYQGTFIKTHLSRHLYQGTFIKTHLSRHLLVFTDLASRPVYSQNFDVLVSVCWLYPQKEKKNYFETVFRFVFVNYLKLFL